MEFKRARTEAQTADRQNEIISACEQIYKKNGFDAVTFKAISELTTFSRPSIYNYYNTKEEIMLDVLSREYQCWYETLSTWDSSHDCATKEEYCAMITESLRPREMLLHLLASNYLIIEKNCSQEKLNEFKLGIQPFFRIFSGIIGKCFPDATEIQKNTYRILFYSLIDGLYPLTHLTEKQIVAMKIAVPDYSAPDFYEMLYQGLLILTANL